MSSQNYKEIFEKTITGNSWWARLAGSQFVTMLTTYVGQLMDMADRACGRYLQETFLSTATKRASILAAAEDKAYIGRRISPSVGKVSVTNKTATPLALPQHTILLSTAAIQYVLDKALQLNPNQVIETTISQLVLKVFKTTVTEEQKFLEVILPKNITAITHKVDVLVQIPSGQIEPWEKRFMFRRTTSTDKVYAEFYKPTEQLGVRFGNGINGLIPPVGSVITLKVWTTSGDTTLIDNQLLEVAGDMTHINDKVEIKTLTPITGGANAETDEETRQGALYTTSFDDQVVWSDDYAHYIKQHIAHLIWVQAWGEFEQEKQDKASNINNINRVFVSSFSEKYSQDMLNELITTLLIETKYLNKKYTYVAVKERPFTITLNGSVTGSKDLNQVEIQIKDAIRAVYGRYPTQKRPVKILEKDVNKLVDLLNVFYDFSIIWSSFPSDIKLEEYVYLDIDNSVFNLTYVSE